VTSGDCLAQDGARGENREQNMKRNSSSSARYCVRCAGCATCTASRTSSIARCRWKQIRWLSYRRHFEAKRTSMDQKSSQLSDHAGDNIGSAPLAAYSGRYTSSIDDSDAGPVRSTRSMSSLQGAWLTGTHSRWLALMLTRQLGHWCTHRREGVG